MFINLSNHKSITWSKEQKEAAEKWGEIMDYPFPNVLADADENDIAAMSEKIVGELMEKNAKAVMCQGEFTLSYSIIRKLKELGIPVLAASSERVVEEQVLEDGTVERISKFRFVRFREYI